ncbi:MAG: hypothetical protein LBS29_04950 [Endomicrobium sp.]|jgi:hypothetical protein|nr:hypothetical protein [Endomicrobium sp.]
MVKFQRLTKAVKMYGADYVYNDIEDFYTILPYLAPKLKGDWTIYILGKSIAEVNKCLEDGFIPEYLDVTIFLDVNTLQSLLLKYPSLEISDISDWDKFMRLIEEFPVLFEKKAMNELYKRVGPKTDDLEKALDSLKGLEYISYKDITSRFLSVNKVYARQVLRLFLLQDMRYAWKLYSTLEEDIGIDIAFYSMRRYMYMLFEEKLNYLSNKSYRDKLVQKVDAYTINYAYYLFTQATSPKQLLSILWAIEKRKMLEC